jgi:GGDEF domain-containing protein
MTEELGTNIVQLGETRGGVMLQRALDANLRVASTPLHAAALLAERHPDAIVLGSEVGWARDLVEALELKARPAVVVVGDRSPATVGLADQWLPAEASTPMARQRLQRAFGRADARQRDAGAGFIDPATGLPNRRAVLRALVRKAEKARLCSGKISLVFINVQVGCRGERQALIEAGATLQRHLRRTEVGGYLERSTLAVVVQGDRRVASGAAARMRTRFAAQGIAVTSTAVEVNLAKPALALLHVRARRRDRMVAQLPFETVGNWRAAARSW